jgi:UDP-N-acetylmuramoyl-tripeptide--D-alanyl-D-alanine ligase
MKKYLANLVLAYFRFFAKKQLKKNPRATIIGITGSAGKTSTRLAIVHILKSRGVVKHSVHANSESGIPLNILGLRPTSYSLFDWVRLIILAPIKLLTNWEHFNYYVVEMGIDSPDAPKNMASLLKIVRPHVGVVLNASLTHSANFDHLVKDTSPPRRTQKLIKVIAKEKMQLAKGIKPSGVAVINIDQKVLADGRKDITTRCLTFGKSVKADLRILSNSSFSYLGQSYKLELGDVYPDYYAYTFAAAITATAAIGIPPSLSLPLLKDYRSPPGRMRIFPGINGSTIIDSSYNASPSTMLEALKLLKIRAKNHKKIAVVGDMRELGISSKVVHKNLADWLLLYCDEAILFGDLTGGYTLPVLLSKKFPVHHFTHMTDLTKYLRQSLRSNSYVLIKGSQNQIFLERAVEGILMNKDDVSKLCRRGKYWDKIRSSTA